MDVVTPQEAALRLGLSRSTTYGLIRSGALPATRIGRGLVIEADDLRRFATAPRPTGRPWSARSCWATLAAAGGWPLPFSLSRSERARAGERAREIADLPSHRFDRRAEASTWFCHPSLIDVLRDDGRLCLAGASAAPAHRADILAADLLEAYVRPDDLAAIAREYTLIPGAGDNVLLRVPSVTWPLPEGRFAPAVVVAWDLIDAGDQRSVRAGRALLRRLAPATP